MDSIRTSLSSGICNIFDTSEEEALKQIKVAMFLSKTAEIKKKMKIDAATVVVKHAETSEDEELFRELARK